MKISTLSVRLLLCWICMVLVSKDFFFGVGTNNQCTKAFKILKPMLTALRSKIKTEQKLHIYTRTPSKASKRMYYARLTPHFTHGNKQNTPIHIVWANECERKKKVLIYFSQRHKTLYFFYVESKRASSIHITPFEAMRCVLWSIFLLKETQAKNINWVPHTSSLPYLYWSSEKKQQQQKHRKKQIKFFRIFLWVFFSVLFIIVLSCETTKCKQ